MSGGYPLGLEFGNSTDAGTNNGNGTSVLAGASNTYGSWVQLIASTSIDAGWMEISAWQVTDINANAFNFQIGIGGSGSEVVIVKDYRWGFSLAAMTMGFPIQVPSGTRIAARAAVDTAGTDTVGIGINLFDTSFMHTEPFAGVESLLAVGTNPNVTSGVGAGTKGSYTQIIASTARDYAGITLGAANNFTTNGVIIDLAVGGAGSEQIIVNNFCILPALAAQGIQRDLYMPIPSGTRVAARAADPVGSRNFTLNVSGIYV